MGRAPRRRRRRSAAIATAVAASLSLVVGKKAYDYGAPPMAPKDCTFTFPDPLSESAVQVVSEPAEPALAFSQRGGTINDASCLNRTAINGIVDIKSVDDVAAALHVAARRGWKVSAAGVRHSMGGQAFMSGNLVLDMRGLNGIAIDRQNRTMTVQSGATWDEVQRRLDVEGLSVVAMQSINIFTVGGSLSVNAHGISHRPGPIGVTVRSMRIMLSDGRIVTASPHENPDLFRHAIGGYGLFGIILDAEIDLTENEIYRHDVSLIDYRAVPALYAEIQRSGETTGLIYGRFSVAPGNFLQTVAVHRFSRELTQSPLEPLQPEKLIWLKRLVLNISKTGKLGRWVRWAMEQNLEPWLHSCLTRNQAMAAPDACLVTRNQEMFDSMAYLRNRLPDTDILQEYFLPPAEVPAFIEGLQAITARNEANLLNVTLRIVHKDAVTALPYAPEDRIALVLYFNQQLNRLDSERLQQTTIDLIDLAHELGGRFYLPYQLAYSPAQLMASYPEASGFFAAKRRYDPAGLFSSRFYEKYGLTLMTR